MKHRLTLLGVAFIALLSWWLLDTEQHHNLITPGDDEHFLDLFIDDFELTSTDETGRADFTIDAERLEHYNDEDHSRIYKPVIQLHSSPDGWQITALTGTIDDDYSMVVLNGDVVMQNMIEEEPMRIDAQMLSIDTEREIIETADAVTITDGKLVLNAIGMRYDNRKQILKLLADIRGTYETNPH